MTSNGPDPQNDSTTPTPAIPREGVSLAVKRRIASVLAHLSAKRAEEQDDGDNHHHHCSHHSSRKGGLCTKPCDAKTANGCDDVDIEDLCKPGPRHSADYRDDDEAYLFDPARFVETQKPVLSASSLPRECYNSRKWFQRELENLFLPSWTMLGREDEIPDPGNYLAEDTEWGGPVAVCRGEAGELHAFANVCCHRGAKILQGSLGRGSSFGLVCPYHAWSYDFDGKLLWAPGMDQSHDFNEDEIRLTPIRVETFHGFVFVNVSTTAPPLLECLGDLPKQLFEWFGPDGVAQDCVVAGRREYIANCNWKFVMENTCETYHTSVVHKNSLGPMKASPLPPHVGDWDAVVVPTKRTVVPLPEDFPGEAEPLPAFAKRTAFVNLFPSLQINVTWDCLWWYVTSYS